MVPEVFKMVKLTIHLHSLIDIQMRRGESAIFQVRCARCFYGEALIGSCRNSQLCHTVNAGQYDIVVEVEVRAVIEIYLRDRKDGEFLIIRKTDRSIKSR